MVATQDQFLAARLPSFRCVQKYGSCLVEIVLRPLVPYVFDPQAYVGSFRLCHLGCLHDSEHLFVIYEIGWPTVSWFMPVFLPLRDLPHRWGSEICLYDSSHEKKMGGFNRFARSNLRGFTWLFAVCGGCASCAGMQRRSRLRRKDQCNRCVSLVWNCFRWASCPTKK